MEKEKFRGVKSLDVLFSVRIPIVKCDKVQPGTKLKPVSLSAVTVILRAWRSAPLTKYCILWIYARKSV